MAMRYTIEKHAVAFPSKVLAREGGAHIYNIQLSEDVDNGWFVGKGAFIAGNLDLYAEAAPTAVTGTVVAQAKNGNYYVEIASCDNGTLFVHTPAIIEEEYNNEFKKEENYFNASGVVARAYQLTYGDIVEISEAGFSAKPSVGDTVTLQAIASKTAMQLGK